MFNWFDKLSSECRLNPSAARHLREKGFTVIDGPYSVEKLCDLTAAYDEVIDEASEPDKRVGRTTTRVHDLVNRTAIFDSLCLCAPVLAACCHVLGQPFKLSNMLARTVHPRTTDAQKLHVDYARDRYGWPMLGFILMIDEFTLANGATRFMPGSHHLSITPQVESIPESEVVSACGPRGAVIIYNGSVLHGHGPNHTDWPRRSVQGAFIRRDAVRCGSAARMQPGTIQRMGPLAKYLLDI